MPHIVGCSHSELHHGKIVEFTASINKKNIEVTVGLVLLVLVLTEV